MEIKRAGTEPSAKGPSDWFTGVVRIDPLFQALSPGTGSKAPVLRLSRVRELCVAYASAGTNALS